MAPAALKQNTPTDYKYVDKKSGLVLELLDIISST